jgi:hypothetical protein
MQLNFRSPRTISAGRGGDMIARPASRELRAAGYRVPMRAAGNNPKSTGMAPDER